MPSRQVSIAITILTASLLIAGGVFSFFNFTENGTKKVASIVWSQQTGSGLSVPACASSSPGASACNGAGQSVVPITYKWENTNHTVCANATIKFVKKPEGTWAALNPSGPSGAGYGMTYAVINNRLYYVHSSGLSQYWDPATNQRVTIPNPPLSIAYPGSAVVGSRWYVFGNVSLRTEVFDTTVGTWSLTANPAPNFGSGNGVRAAAIGTDIYVVTGTSMYRYNTLTDTWIVRANLGLNTYGDHGVAVYGGRLYLFGFENVTGFVGVASYDPATNAWTMLSDFPGGPFNSRVAGPLPVYNNSIYLTGPTNAADTNIINWQYYPATNTWVQRPESPAASFAITDQSGPKGLINGRIYHMTTGGSHFSYDPTVDTAPILITGLPCPTDVDQTYDWVGGVLNSQYSYDVTFYSASGLLGVAPIPPGNITTLNCISQANLVISAHSATPIPIYVNQSITIRGTVFNQGTASAGAISNTRFRIDRGNDGTWDSTNNQSTGNLAAGASEVEQWTAGVGGIPGIRKYEICADSTLVVTETDNNDNCVEGFYDVLPLPPDLIIDAPLPPISPASPTQGQSITFSGTVRNQGSSATGPTQTAILIDVAPAGAGAEDVTVPVATAGIAAAGSAAISGNWTGTLGNHSYRICADSANEIIESNEANNCSAPVSFTVAPPALAATLTASPPPPGVAPFNTSLIADITAYGGNPADTMNYTFWWNCPNGGTDVAALSDPAQCNDPNNPLYGFKVNGTLTDPQSTPIHTYAVGSYTAKVVIERNGATPIERTLPITVTLPPLGGSCAADKVSATVSETVTWNAVASGGDGTYTYDWSGTGNWSVGGAGLMCSGEPSAACSIHAGSYLTTGNKTASVTIRSGALAPYTASCSNSVNVSGRIISFAPTPAVILPAQTSTLSWTTQGYTNGQCTIDQGVGLANPAAGGSAPTSALTQSTVFTITCTDSIGSQTRQTTVHVGTAPTFEEVNP